MTVRRASRALQLTRLGMATTFLALGVLAALAGSWLLGVVLVVGAGGAGMAWRKAEWDPDQARQAGKDYAYPRLIGAGVGLAVFVVAAAAGLLD